MYLGACVLLRVGSIREQLEENFVWEPGQKEEEVRLVLVPLNVTQMQLLSLLPFPNGSHSWAVWPRVVHTVLLRL